MVAPLRRVIVKRPAEAYVSAEKIQAEWRDLAFTAPPDLARAAEEHAAFVALLQGAGAEVLYLPLGAATTLDSIYTHDPGVVTEAGVVFFNMGKPQRRGEGPALRAALEAWGVPVLGEVAAPAMAEGGDLLWVDAKTLVAGRSHRTNAAGVARLRELLTPLGVTVVESGLPSWRGPADLLHLLSLVSPGGRRPGGRLSPAPAHPPGRAAGGARLPPASTCRRRSSWAWARTSWPWPRGTW